MSVQRANTPHSIHHRYLKRARRRIIFEQLEDRLLLASTTVVVHGADFGSGGPLHDMGQELYSFWSGQDTARLRSYQPESGALQIVTANSFHPDPEHEIVVFDWSAESNNFVAGKFDEAAGDALLAMLVEHDLAETDYLHLVGHSRGAVVVSETAQRLLNHGFDVHHVTLLDQEPGPPISNSAGPPYAWSGIQFVDNYYGHGTYVPLLLQGEPVDGSHNIDFTTSNNTQLVQSADIDGNGKVDHTEVRLWYTDTINDAEATEGFVFRHNTAQRNDASIQGNKRGLEVVPSVFNGDFEVGIGETIPGWERHGGEGAGHLDFALFDSTRLELDWSNESRTHNRLYIPNDAEVLTFRLQRRNASSNDLLHVKIDGVSQRVFDLDETDGDYVTSSVPIAQSMRGQTHKLSFEIRDNDGGRVDSEVLIDDVEFASVAPPAAGSPAEIQIMSDKFRYAIGEIVTVSGRLLDINGNPVPNREIDAHDSLRQQTRLLGSTTSDGRFEIRWSEYETRTPGLFGVTFRASGTDVESTIVIDITDPALQAVPLTGPGSTTIQVGVLQEVNNQTRVVVPAHDSGVPEPTGTAALQVATDVAGVIGGAIGDTLSRYTDPGEIGVGRALGLVALGVGCAVTAPACAAASTVFLAGIGLDVVTDIAKRSVALNEQRGNITAQQADEYELYIDTAALGVGIGMFRPSSGMTRATRILEDFAAGATIGEGIATVGSHVRELTIVGKDEATGDVYAIVLGTGADRHGDNSASATPVSSQMSTAGLIEIPQDEDWFAVPMSTGRSYEFETILNGLSDSQLTLYDRNGSTVLATNDDGGQGKASRITFAPTASGTYYLAVTGSGTNAGAFGLEIDETIVSAGSPEIEVRDEHGRNLVDGASKLEFGPVPHNGLPFSRTLTVTNVGNSPLSLSGLNVSSPFVIRDDVVPSLGVSQSDTIRVELGTGSTGVFNRTLAFTTNDLDEGNFTLDLEGTVQTVTPPPSVTPSISSVRLLPNTVAFGSPTTLVTTATHGSGAAALDRVEVYRDMNNNGVIDNGDLPVGTSPTDGSGRASTEFHVFYSKGAHTLLVQAIDDSGRLSETESLQLTVTDDRPTDPVIVRLSAQPGAVQPGDDLTLRWLARDNTEIDHVEFYLYSGPGTATSARVNTASIGGAADGRLTPNATQQQNDRKFVWTIPNGIFGGNDYRIGMVAVDDEGNSTLDFTEYFSVIAPGAHLVSLFSSPTTVIANQTVTFTATVHNAAQAQSVEFVRDLNRNGRFDGSDVSIATRSNFDSNGRISIDVSTTGFTPGSHSFLAILNLPGNETGNRVLRKISVTGIPNQPPQVGTTTISPSSVTRGDNITVTTSGISDDNGIGSIVFVWDANGDGEPGGGDIVVGRTSTVVGGQASAIIPTTAFDLGSQRIIVRVRDNEGKFRDSGAATVQVNAPVLPTPFIGGIAPSDLFQPSAILFTLTAVDVLHADEVRFYHDTNTNGNLDGSDELLRIDDDGSNDYFWRNSPSNAGFPNGVNRFFAQPFNSQGTGGNVVTATAEFHATDTQKPTASLLSAPDITSGVSTYEFVVRYQDNIAIRVDDFDNLDARVISADGAWGADATFIAADEPVEGPIRLATYRIAARDDQFTPEHNGTYRIEVKDVRDTNGNPLDRVEIGTFEVSIPFEDDTPPAFVINDLSIDINVPTPINEPEGFGFQALDLESGIDDGSIEFFFSRRVGDDWTAWSERADVSLSASDDDGLYRVYGSVRNRAGLSGLTDTHYLMFDRDAPSRVQGLAFVSDTGQLDDDGLTHAPRVTVSWDNASDETSHVAGYFYAFDQLTPSVSGSFSMEPVVTVALATEGTQALYVQAVDYAGNLSPVNAAIVTLDSTNPTVVETTPQSGSLLGNGPLVLDIAFSEDMDPAQFSPQDVAIAGERVGSVVVSTVAWLDTQTVRIGVSGTWSDGIVDVSFVDPPSDIAGNPVSSTIITSFTISSNVQPEIEVRTSGNNNILDGKFVHDFGSILLGDPSPQATFTVKNTGDAALSITDIDVPDGVHVVQQPSSTIAPGQSSNFVINLANDVVGPVSGQLRLTTNDADENPFDFSVRGRVHSPGITAVYDHAIPISASGTEQVRDLAVDSAGNVVATGIFTGAVDFDPGSGTTLLTSRGHWDAFIAKYDPAGALLWAKSFGGTSTDEARAVAIGENGKIHIVGDFRNTVDFDPGSGTTNRSTANTNVGPDAFHLTVTASGQFDSVNTFGSTGIDVGYDVDVKNNEVYIVGGFEKTVDFNPGGGVFNITAHIAVNDGFDGFLVKLNSSGGFVYARSLGGTSTDLVHAVAVADNGAVAIAGEIRNGASGANMNPQGPAHVLTPLGVDAFVSYYNSSGTFQWAKKFNGRTNVSGSDRGHGVTFDGLGNIVVAGSNWGTLDEDPGSDVWDSQTNAFVVSLNTSGSLRWVARVDSSTTDFGQDLATGTSGDIYLTGYFGNTATFVGTDRLESHSSNGQSDIYAMRLGVDGALVWVRTIGSTTNDRTGAIATAPNNDVVFGGYYSKEIDSDPTSGLDLQSHSGGDDGLIVRLVQPEPITNNPPILDVISEKTIAEGSTLTVTAAATDEDDDQVTYSLDDGAPAGATIHPTTGLFSWTPSEAQAPRAHTITIRATDDASTPFSDSRSFVVLATEQNVPPVLAPIGDKSVAEEDALTFTASATDADAPANALTFSLDAGAPAGSSIHPTSGAFSWTPSEAEGPGTFDITVRVHDDGVPVLSAIETITVTVAEANVAPVLAAVGDKSVDEEDTLTFTVSATDADAPVNTLTFSLDAGAPAGSSIHPTSGLFRWMPSEVQGPGSFNITVRVTDDGAPALSDTEMITVNVGEANVAPVLASLSDKSVDEGDALTFTATATDADAPANALTFSLDAGAPSGSNIHPTSGVFSWTPSENQGPGTFDITVRVNDDGVPNLDDFQTLTVTVGEANVAPVMAPVGDKSVDEEDTLTFTVSATDADAPANTLTFSLDAGAPAGSSIHPTSGAFSWTPSEAQGPGSFNITVRATDDGVPKLSDFETITVIVGEANVTPTLAPIGDKSVDEGDALTFTASATDADTPANTLTFSLDAGAPAGSSIHPTRGAFSWTPSEAQGPGSFNITVRVTDDGVPKLSDFETITVTVDEANVTPVLASVGDKSVNEGDALTFTASATDADKPVNTLTFSLDSGAPAGSSIHPASGAFSWTPTEAQGPGSFNITVRVTDDSVPKLSDFETITVTVAEANVAPVLSPVADKSVNEGDILTFTASATDADTPANKLTFSLNANAPTGANIDANTGEFTWRPNEAQGPGVHFLTIMVTDDGVGNLQDQQTIEISVAEVNQSPVISKIGNRSVNEGELLSLTVAASDADAPTNQLSFALDPGSPQGASIDSKTGEFAWTPTEDQGPGNFEITIRVVDDGAPSLQASETIEIAVAEVNRAPELTPLADAAVDVGKLLTFSFEALDPDNPRNGLTYGLGPNAPLGASVNPETGQFQWTPDFDHPLGAVEIIATAIDDGVPPLSDQETFEIVVTRPSFSNPRDRFDVDNNGFVSIPDAAAVAGYLHSRGLGEIPLDYEPGGYIDVDDNGRAQVLDLALVVGELNRKFGNPQGEPSVDDTFWFDFDDEKKRNWAWGHDIDLLAADETDGLDAVVDEIAKPWIR